MAFKVRAFANCDDVHLVWDPGEKIDGCVGFTIECRRRRNGTLGKPAAISNRVGFEADAPKPGQSRPSREWPFQRYSWTDHAADLGDEIQYRVIARVGEPGALADGPASAWTPIVKLDPDAEGVRALFNRGFAISQFVSRLMRKKKLTPKAFKESLSTLESPIRRFLSGVLRDELLAMLDEVREDDTLRAYAALYELEDDELLEALEGCGDKLEIVLANGSVDAAGEDQNARARKRLKKAGAVVHDRMVSPGALGHNKFVVVAALKQGKVRPLRVLTGSTNWTKTGLCTQVNNAAVVTDRAVAAAFLEQWERLRDAGSAKPSTLAKTNPSPLGPFKLESGKATIWFTPVRQKADIDALTGLVNAAQEGVLFVMFNPGSEPLKTLLARQKAGLYVRGVVNQVGQGEREEIRLIKAGLGKKFFLDVIEPHGVKAPLASWAREVTRGEFKSQIGHAITHAKVLVIDPFGAKPIVVTGSHNFSAAASGKNDENFLVIEGNRKLAEAYAVNCMMTYHHYRWRQYLQEAEAKGLPPFEFLRPDDRWQARRTSAVSKADLGFWL